MMRTVRSNAKKSKLFVSILSLTCVLDANAFLSIPVPECTQGYHHKSLVTFLAENANCNAHHLIDVIDPDPDQAMDNSVYRHRGKNENKPKVRRQYEMFRWKQNDTTERDYNINYRVEGPIDGIPVLLVHGFGANVNHFRFQFPALVAEGYRVYAVDLLGFGASDKPKDANYSIELFVRQLQDFVLAMEENHKDNSEQHNWIAAGNSIGGLCCLGLAAALPNDIQGVILFNTAGGMSSFRYENIPLVLRPVLWFVQKVILGNSKFGGDFFENFKTRENVESILMTQGVYGNTTNVDEELLEILLGPSDDEGARDVFLKVFGGEPGPTPESFLANIDVPVLALWGEADPWTVIAMGQSFGKNAKQYRLEALPGAGHCPHDECPELCHEIMLPWMKDITSKKTSMQESSA